MAKNTWKSNSVQMIICLWIKYYSFLCQICQIVRSVFQEDKKYYPQVFLNEFLYELWMLEYDRIDISEGIGVNKRQMHQKSVIFVIIGIFR